MTPEALIQTAVMMGLLVLAGGDIRPHVIDALQSLVGEIKQHCVVEKEIY